LIAIGYQYARRRRGAAIAIFVAGIMVTSLTSRLWGDTSLFGGEPSVEHEPWARDPAVSRVHLRTVDAVTGRPLPAKASLIDFGDRKLIVGPVVLDGLPAGYDATPYTLHVELRLGDQMLSSTSSNQMTEREVSIESRVERWATLLDVASKAFDQNDHQPVTYVGTFDFTIDRHEPLATFPLRVGASYNDGTRAVRVTDMKQGPGGCLIHYATRTVFLVTQSIGSPELALRYRLRDGLHLVDVDAAARHPIPGTYVVGGFVSMNLLPVPMLQLATRPSYPVVPVNSPTEATAHCEDIIVDVERVSYAGHLTRTLELHDFQLANPFAAH
jgi:hypothetical protein